MAQPAKRPARARSPPGTLDHLLGAFSRIQPNETLDHAIRYLGTWSGTDKALMITQYSSKLVVPLFELQHALLARITSSPALAKSGSEGARRAQRLAGLVGDARVLFRIWGILPILKWMIALERTPPPTRLLHNIERIQGWSMLLYCPIEAVAYLAGHSILSLSPKTQNRLWLISARFWALYVGLQLLHLVEDNRLLRLRARALERSRGHPTPVPRAQQRAGATDVEKTAAAVSEEQQLTRRMWNELDERKEAIMNELWVNLGYLPLTVHWSLPAGLFSSEVWVGLFGTIAAGAGLRSGWKGTASPPVPPPAQ